MPHGKGSLTRAAETLCSWPVVGVGAPLLFTLGVAAMFGDQYRIAAIFYFASMVVVTAKVLTWEDARRAQGKVKRAGVSILVVVAAMAAFWACLWWIDHRKDQVASSADQIADKVIQRLAKDAASAKPESGEIVRNGGFERRDNSWTFLTFGGAKAKGRIDTDVKRSGYASFRLSNESAVAPNVYGLLGQRVVGLTPNRWYRLRFWIKSEHSIPGAVFYTTEMPWVFHKPPGGRYDWLEVVHNFTPGALNSVDLVFVIQAKALVWIDDVAIDLLLEQKSSADEVPKRDRLGREQPQHRVTEQMLTAEGQ